MPTATPNKADVLNLALIGAGPWGRNYIRTLAEMPGLRLSLICSNNPETATLVPTDIQINGDWKAVIAASDIDGVIIAAPSKFHAEMTLAAIERGLPVLIEKPLALNLADAEAVEEAATKKDVPVLVHHVHLFQPGYAEIKKQVLALGPIRSIKCKSGNAGPYRPDTDPLWDWGPHDIAFCLDLMAANPARIAAKNRDQTETGRGVIFDIVLEFENNVVATIETGNGYEARHRRLEVEFESETLILDDNAAQKLLRRSRGAGGTASESPISISDQPPLSIAVANFAAAIRGEPAQYIGARLGVEVVKVLEHCATRITGGGAADG